MMKPGHDLSNGSSAARPTDSDLGERLASDHLRRVAQAFPDVRSAERAVATSAIYRASKIILARHAEVLRAFDIGATHFELVSMLYRADSGQMSMGELGRMTMQHPASMTYAVGALEKRGLLTRRPDPNNRRIVLVEITPAGSDLVSRAVPRLADMDWGLHDLPIDDAVRVAVALSRIDVPSGT